MEMKCAAVVAVLACLLIVSVQGQARTSVRRCLCQGPGANHVRRQNIDKIEVYPASASCEKLEMIVVLKKGAKRCLNPESSFAKNYISKALQKRSELEKTAATTRS